MKKVTFQTEKDIYIVSFGINQIIDIEDAIGGFSKLEQEVGVKTIRSIFYHGLKANHQGMSMLTAGEAMDDVLQGMDLEEFAQKLTNALMGALQGTPSK